jgi:3-hydroxyisobutyrate dehydrogenase
MKIALLGTGLLGYPMAQRLLATGHETFVYNRTLAKAELLQKEGAIVCESSTSAISQAECIILVLPDAKSIEETLCSGNFSLEGKTVIQMGTISPSQSIEIQKKVYERQGEYLECPVLGSRSEAQSGQLLLMVGTTQEKFDKWKDVLSVFGPPRLVGAVGQAAAMKLALNQIIASHAVGFSLSLALIKKNGLRVDDFMVILKQSSLFAPMVEKKLPNWLRRNYDHPNFSVKHLLKDVELILKEAQDKGMITDVVEAVRRLLIKTVAEGWADKDYSAVFETINKKD